MVRERVEHIKEHRPVEKEYVVETRATGATREATEGRQDEHLGTKERVLGESGAARVATDTTGYGTGVTSTRGYEDTTGTAGYGTGTGTGAYSGTGTGTGTGAYSGTAGTAVGGGYSTGA